jgi:Flp pilus assembly pilin Flp
LDRIQKFFRRDSGQDLAEYCLLTALLALIALGIFIHVSGGLQGLWGSANSALATGGSSGVTSTGGASTSQGNH